MSESRPSVLPLCVQGLRLEHQKRRLLDVAQLTVHTGDLLCIVGPNGAGKSLLLKAMAALLPQAQGSVNWGGRPPERSAYGQLAMLLQSPVMLRRTVAANIDFALKVQARQLSRSARKRAVQESLQLADMQHLAEASARLLSGGERQRLALVRALACKPELLLLDEPTASMDPASTAWFESTVQAAHGRGLSVAMVTHDLHQAKRMASRVALLHRGRVVEDSDTRSFFEAPRSDEARAFVSGELLF